MSFLKKSAFRRCARKTQKQNHHRPIESKQVNRSMTVCETWHI